MSHGPKGAQCEYNIDEETNEANRTDNEMCKNDAKRVANLEQVTIRQGQKSKVKGMNQKQWRG